MSWSIESERRLIALVDSGHNFVEISAILGVSQEAARSKYRYIRNDPSVRIPRINDSPYPVYDTPLETEGDALVISDPEFPFHHAGFLNRILDLAVTWGITNCIIAGDVLHFQSLSLWNQPWIVPANTGISEEAETDLLALDLPATVRQQMVELIQKHAPETNDDSISNEIKIAKKELLTLGEMFKRIDYVIGNHDGRFLAALNSPLFADKLLEFIGIVDPVFRIAPYYYSKLISGGKLFRIEHPRSAAKITAYKLASKFGCNIIMGHSHLLMMGWDISGKFYAIQAGCTCDELRMPYAAQRSTTSDFHALGAVIVREGVPWLLNEQTPWARMKRL